MQHMSNLLASFGKRIGIETLAFEEVNNGVGRCSLAFDEIMVNIEYNSEERLCYLHTALAQVPKESRVRNLFLPMVLELNCAYRGTNGGVLGLHHNYGVIYSNKIGIEVLTDPTFEKFLEEHINFSESLYEHFVSIIESITENKTNTLNDGISSVSSGFSSSTESDDLLRMMSTAIRI